MKAGWAKAVAKTQTESSLLEYVAFWWPKAKPRRDGHTWLVKSVAELSAQLPGHPSDRTVRRAMKAAEAAGFLIVECHWHPYRHNAKRSLWIRLDEAAIDRAMTASRPDHDRFMTGTYIQRTDNHLTSKQEKRDATHPAGQPEGQGDMSKGSDFLLKRKSKSIATGMAVFDPSNKDAGSYPSVTTPTVAYNALRAACLAAGYPPPGTLTQKASGQLKTLLQRLSAEGVGPEKVSAFLFDITAKWPEFSGWYAAVYKGAVAPYPNPAGLLTKIVEAVAFLDSYKTKPVEKKGGSSNLDDGL